jgi:hypothetical protein
MPTKVHTGNHDKSRLHGDFEEPFDNLDDLGIVRWEFDRSSDDKSLAIPMPANEGELAQRHNCRYFIACSKFSDISIADHFSGILLTDYNSADLDSSFNFSLHDALRIFS